MFALVAGLSEIVARAADGQQVFIEVPCVAETGALAAGFMRLHLSKLSAPICYGSGRQGDATFGHAQLTQGVAAVIPCWYRPDHVSVAILLFAHGGGSQALC
jgi:hypothetical protein